ncbi:unnamed protein product [Ilex paraguariensis]|uniref:Uncharacterized protein n=1 Tax=Ilex paraguariensis TaxID=185542 RepID=A0ABC8TY63_9AQUA
MSSTGASFAHVYVQQNRQKEKMKRMEEEKGRGVEDGGGERKVEDDKGGKSNKIHPGGSISSDSAGSFGETKNHVA